MWTFFLILTTLFSVAVFAYHVFQLWQAWELWQAPTEKSLKSFLADCHQFAEKYYNYSPQISDYVKSIKDPYQSEAFKNYLMNKDLGPHALEQQRLICEHFQNKTKQKKKTVDHIAKTLPIIGWSWVLTAICFYFAGYPISESSFILSSQFVGFAVIAAGYGLAVHYLFLEPQYKRLDKDLAEMAEKHEIINFTIHNLIAGRSHIEVKESLKLFIKDEIHHGALKSA